ncbi:hypothetical protein [Hymenobacter bucti]|uniref:DUF3108 domain-containing protein n=1 Tax=Hymenobacter bucti TaxID=1844114 RepID=A0ABW4R059_9BACT
MLRNILLLSLAALGSASARAQALTPAVGVGTTFSYNFELHGQHAPFELTIANATDTLKLKWRIRNLAGGVYAVSPAAWQRGTALHVAQPLPGPPVRLPDSQTFMMLSKSAYATLLAQRRFTYNNTVYELRDDPGAHPLLLGGQPLDVLHVVAQGDLTELWILRNAAFPVICQMAHSPLGVNYVLTNLK